MNKRSIIITVSLLCSFMCWGQGFKNPVLPGFHADPSVCRVGDDFYDEFQEYKDMEDMQ